ncbi:MAG TPA: GNAT family N-acetyltransferase [Casimicrobiaceae bacterium]|nr:GNAT family N-acetyltransferase [Casimicrobiaceae bacterium]
MPDMLVRLYALPDPSASRQRASNAGIVVRRPARVERDALREWVRRRFSSRWADECDTAFGADPPSCFIADRDGAIVGFACHDCTRRNFFGPAGVDEAVRGQGVGAALTIAALDAMRASGYAYAIIGGVGPEAFYRKTVGATLIDGSTPGIYDARSG